ncbi:LysR family transcriptional regulator [Fictibacillus phosphorivorans]|uniref:LysR family transcriptional regulator n=1 Tax=Fictibacillus phosphorivorans TaxID=1221500 RepID=A0A161RR03_9BACL|nr:LysR family transcriptional regulator [Fictibacillus phosphorivorans]KZE63739.1 LysR family transcriptional regulator [Fictibacillus phosphorivorans]
MDIRQLTYFHAVAKYKSFTKASGVLHLSQPALSKMVKSLEDELEMELIDRSSRKIELTEAGEIVFEQSRMILDSLDNLSANLYDLMHLKKGKIKIGIPPLIGFLFFPKLIKKFKTRYPDIKIQMVEHGANEIQQEVHDGLLDLAIVVLPADQEEFEVVSFIEEQLLLFVHSSHPYANRKTVEMKELSEELFILFKEGFTLHDRVIHECLKAGFHPKISYESSQWDFISGMIGEGLGVSIFPQSISEKVDSDSIKAIPIVNPTLPYQLAIIKKKGKYVTFATQEFIHMLLEE